MKPGFALAHYNLGLALEALGHTRDAIMEYQLALKDNPKLGVARQYLAKALTRQKKSAKAAHTHPTQAATRRAQAAKAARVAAMMAAAQAPTPSSTPSAPLLHGKELYDQGNLVGAITEFKKAVAADPGDAEGHYRLAVALDDRGDHAAAVQEYHSALRLRPNYAAAYSSLGTSLYLAGSRAEARRAWHQAISLGDPQEAQNAASLLKTYP